MPSRRTSLSALALAAFGAAAPPLRGFAAPADSAHAERALRQDGPGLVVMMRHADAPGTFDPPGFRLDDCGTQRNLGEAGRAQARRIGAWFRGRGLVAATVRSSPWCRCVDTATLAFGRAESWRALVSGLRDASGERGNVGALKAELAERAARSAIGFDVWVTHQIVMTALTGRGAASGEMFVLRQGSGGTADVLATLAID